jgi:hypothetical protein
MVDACRPVSVLEALAACVPALRAASSAEAARAFTTSALIAAMFACIAASWASISVLATCAAARDCSISSTFAEAVALCPLISETRESACCRSAAIASACCLTSMRGAASEESGCSVIGVLSCASDINISTRPHTPCSVVGRRQRACHWPQSRGRAATVTGCGN